MKDKMFEATRRIIILCLFVSILRNNEADCSAFVKPKQDIISVESIEQSRTGSTDLISLMPGDFNTYPEIGGNKSALDHFGYSAYSGVVDYISKHLPSMVPGQYKPFDSVEDFTATLRSNSPIRSTSRSLSSNDTDFNKLISNNGLLANVTDYMDNAEALVSNIATQVATVAKQADSKPAKRGIDTENDEIIEWMLNSKNLQPIVNQVKFGGSRGARGIGKAEWIGKEFKSLISDKLDGDKLLGSEHHLGGVKEHEHENHHGLLQHHLGKEAVPDHHDNHRHHHHHEGHKDHHHEGHKDHHHDGHKDHHHEGHKDHHHDGHKDHFKHDHHDKDEFDRDEPKNVFESVSGNFNKALKDSFDNISDGIGHKKSDEGRNEKESVSIVHSHKSDNSSNAISELSKTISSLPQKLNEPSLLKGPANLMNSVLKTSLDTMKSSSKEMDTLGNTISDSGIGKLFPGAIQAVGGGVSFGGKAVEAVTKKDHKESKVEEDPDASFYEDDEAGNNNNPGLFDSAKKKYFSKECRFRIACEVGRMLVSPMPSEVLKQYSNNKFLKDFQNRYTKAMTFGATRKACDRYYCVFVNMMGGPGPFAQGVMEIVTAMNKNST